MKCVVRNAGFPCRRALPALLTLVVLVQTLAAAQRATSAQAQQHDRIVAVDVKGQAHEGRLAAVDAESVTIAGPQPLRLNTRDLISLRFPGRKAETRLPHSVVFLENGDRLAATAETMDGEKLTAKWLAFRDAPSMIIPVETIRGIFLNGPEMVSSQRSAQRELLDRRESSDLVMLANGDRLTGELKRIDPSFVTLENTGGETRVDRGRVQWIGSNQDLISFPRSSARSIIVALTDGSRVTARSLKLAGGGQLQLDAAYGGEIGLSLSSVVAMLFVSDRVSYLSDIEPVAYEFTPFLSTTWPLRKDRAVDGGPLCLRGVEYVKGLGLHSRSRVRYRLDGQYRQFRAVVGIDDSAGGRGNARFAVEADGRRVFESGELTGKDAQVPVGPIEVAGARELTLIVEFGKHGDILDRADWCEALLVK